MDINTYQLFAKQGILQATKEKIPVVGFALGLAGEAGEVVDDIKKLVYHGKAINTTHTAEELGDVMWYIANIASELGFTMDYIINANVKKLIDRYPSMYKEFKGDV